MAIDTQKLLPPSPSVKSLPQAKITSITLTSKDKKNVNTIRVRTIQIDKILKGTLAADKKRINDKKKEASKQRKEDIETKLEEKPKEKKKITMPKILPKMGFFDWIKNFIGNIILGWFAVGLLDHTSLLGQVFTGIAKVGGFIIDWGGKILNGLVTLVDEGYKLYDGLRDQVEKIFGEGGVKKFDDFMGVLNKVLNATFIIALAIVRAGPKLLGRGFKGRGGGFKGRGGRGTRTASGGRTLDKPGRNPFRTKPKVTTGGRPGFRMPGTGPKVTGTFTQRVAGKIIKPIVKRIPVIGGLLEFAISWATGDPIGKAAFKGIGTGLGTWIGTAIGSIPVFIPFGGPLIGGVLGAWGGAELGGVMYDGFFGGNKQSPSKKKKIQGRRRGGKISKPSVRRTISSTVKKKKRRAPQFNTVKIELGKDISGTLTKKDAPTGKDVGKSKIFGLFSNPFASLPEAEQPKDASTLDFIKKYGDKFIESDYVGPLLGIGIKAFVGQKASDMEYENAAKGVLALSRMEAAAFASGGRVDGTSKKVVENIKSELKESLDPLVSQTIGDIQKNLGLLSDVSSGATGSQGSSAGDSATGVGRVRRSGPPGAGSTYATSSSGEYGDILDLISSVEAKSYDTINAGHIDGLSTMTIAGARRAALDSGIGSGAMGRYQQMPQFVLDRARSIGLDPNKDLFSPENQDKLAILLINGAGYKAWKSGSMTTEKFAYNLAGTWRGLPEGPSNLTYQDQYASGNKAHTTWDNVMSVLGGSKTSGSVSSGQYNKGPGPNPSMKLGDNKDASLGSKIAGELGYFMKSKKGSLPVTGSIHQHPKHPPQKRRSYFSYHNENRALDIGGWSPSSPEGGGADEQAPVLKALLKWNKEKGVNPIELIHGSPAYKGVGDYREYPDIHHHHVHVAYHKGGKVTGERWAKVLTGEYVIDRDSTKALESNFPGFLDAINKADSSGAIQVLRSYAEYEVGATQQISSRTKYIPVPVPSSSSSKSGSSISNIVVGNNSFDSLVPG